jgi:hypothetical protein
MRMWIAPMLFLLIANTGGGENWQRLGIIGFDAVGFAAIDAGWAVGEDGRIAWFRGEVPR